MTIANVVVDGSQQISLLGVVDGQFRTTVIRVTSCLHFNKDNTRIFLYDNINITMSGMPVTLQNDITFLTQIANRQILTPDSHLQMR